MMANNSSEFWSTVWSNLTENNHFATKAYFESITLESWLNDNGFQSYQQPLQQQLNITSIEQLSSINEQDIRSSLYQYNNFNTFEKEFLKLITKYSNFVSKTVSFAKLIF